MRYGRLKVNARGMVYDGQSNDFMGIFMPWRFTLAVTPVLACMWR
jgi:hypothetical protein